MVDAVTQKKLPLMEIFGPTIQGEGSVLGQQTYFIRLGLCDYKCQKCDSMHAVDPITVSNEAEWLTQPEILSKFLSSSQHQGTDWVTLSGGNPAIHDLEWLTEQLVSKGFRIAIETQGTFCPGWLENCEVVTVSPKGPGMGERFNEDEFTTFLSRGDLRHSLTVKVVVFNEEDVEFASKIAEMMLLNGVSLDKLFLSQGNPYPPGIKSGHPVPTSTETLRSVLAHQYLRTFDKLKEHPILSTCKFLPQFHVWLWGNKQGV